MSRWLKFSVTTNLVTSLALVLLLVPSPGFGQEELEDYYRKWLEQDVVYIITPEERSVFLKLTTPEEKDQFIEQMWLRRDTNPRTSINEFKEEHYRRIAYANTYFKSGIEGWRTDRGRTYIRFGPPQSIQHFPTGHTYFRPMSEGGGMTTTYAYEVWFYRDLGEIGQGIEIEFVDPTGTGEYRLALSDLEKDAMLNVPGAGETMREALGLETRAGRIRSDSAGRSLGLEGDPLTMEGANPFLRLEQYAALQHPPSLQFQDLRALVEAQVHYEQIPFRTSSHIFRISQDLAFSPLTLQIAHSDLTFEPLPDGKNQRATVNVYGQVSTLGRQLAYQFEDVIHTVVPMEQNAGHSLYQRTLPLKPGRYKVNLVVKNLESDRIGSLEQGLVIPSLQTDRLSLSSLLLADYLGTAKSEELYPDPFVTSGGLKVYPSMERNLPAGTRLRFYFEIYNAALDQTDNQPSVEISYEITDQAGSSQRAGMIPELGTSFQGNRITVAHIFPKLDIPVGEYSLRVKVRDVITGQTAEQETDFRVTSEPDPEAGIQ